MTYQARMPKRRCAAPCQRHPYLTDPIGTIYQLSCGQCRRRLIARDGSRLRMRVLASCARFSQLPHTQTYTFSAGQENPGNAGSIHGSCWQREGGLMDIIEQLEQVERSER